MSDTVSSGEFCLRLGQSMIEEGRNSRSKVYKTLPHTIRYIKVLILQSKLGSTRF